ncbi:MAG: glycosyltransferase [Balneolaceae bacterium]
MNPVSSLEEVYDELYNKGNISVLVHPKIRYAYKQSDYAYLLFRTLFTQSRFRINNLSAATHWKLIFANRLKKQTVLHYHWLECTGVIRFVSFLYKWLNIILFIWMKGKMVWTIHNQMPPDSKFLWLNYRIRRWMAKNADLLLVHCQSVIPELSKFFGVDESKFRVIPHPDFPSFLMPRAAAVESINLRFNANIKIQDRLFLVFGHISAYKQIEPICEIFREEPVHKKLVIAGPVKKGQMKLFKRLRRIARNSENIILIPRFIKEEYVPEFMNAADFIIFNYKDVMAAGGAALGKSYNKKIVLPRKYCLQELNGSQSFFFESEAELKEIVQKH